MFKKALSLVLACCILLPCFTVASFGAEIPDSTPDSTPVSYTVTFDGNGVEVTPKTAVTDSDGYVTVPTLSSKKYSIVYDAQDGVSSPVTQTYDASCLGWTKDLNDTTNIYECGKPAQFTADTTLYAVWAANANATVSDYKPSRIGYIFLGWSTNAEATKAEYLEKDALAFTEDTTLYAIWEEMRSYTITFDPQGGTVRPPYTTVSEGKEITFPTPSKQYTVTYNANGGDNAPAKTVVDAPFAGWSEQADKAVLLRPAGYKFVPSKDATVYAWWNSVENVTLTSDIPVYRGHRFMGWTLEPNPEVDPDVDLEANPDAGKPVVDYASGAAIDLKGDVTLYAVWEDLPTPTVTFNPMGGTVDPELASQTVFEGESIKIPKPEKSFTLDFDANGGTITSKPVVVELKCRGWAETTDNPTAIFSATGEATATLFNSTVLYALWEDASVILDDSTFNPTREGYVFLGWSADKDATAPTYVNNDEVPLTDNLTLYAIWEKKCTVTFDAKGGTVPAEWATQIVQKGTRVYLPTPSKQFTLSFDPNGGVGLTPDAIEVDLVCLGWTEDEANETTIFSCNIHARLYTDLTLYAYWDNASATINTTTPLPTKEKHICIGWSTDKNATEVQYKNGDTVPLTEDTVLYAVWERIPEYTVTFDAMGGTVNPTKYENVLKGTDVVMPKPSKSFTLSYDANGATFAFEQKTVVFEFEAWTANLDEDVSDLFFEIGEKATIVGDTTFYAKWKDPNLTITSNAPSRENYKFKGWATDKDATVAEYAVGAPIVLNSDVTLYAVWELIPIYTFSFNANGGETTPDSITAKNGTQITMPVTSKTYVVTFDANGGGIAPEYVDVTEECYGWINENANPNQSGNQTYPPNETATINQNATFKAVWNGKEITVRDYSPTYEQPEPKVFLGWSTDKNATEPEVLPGEKYNATGEITLYGVWRDLEEYTVNFDATGGTVTPETDSVYEGLTMEIPTPTRQYKLNYSVNGGEGVFAEESVNAVCLGWSKVYGDSTNLYLCGTEVKFRENLTLYAVWQNNIFTVSTQIPVRDGYTFLGWAYTQDATRAIVQPGATISVSNSTTLYAVWRSNTPDSIRISAPSSNLTYKSSMKLTASFFYQSNPNAEIIWTSSDTSIATVDTHGNVISVGTGNVTITATISGTNISDSVVINVSRTWWQWIIHILLLGFLWY